MIAQEPTVGGAEPSNRRPARRVVRGVALVAVIGVVVGLLTWQILAQTALGGVRMVFDAAPVRCENGSVGLTPDPPEIAEGAFREDVYFDDAFYEPVVDIGEGTRCALRLQVINHGWADVEVTTIGVPGMAQRMEWPVVARHANPNGQNRLPDREDSAEFAIEGIAVPSGATQIFTVIVEYAGAEGTMTQCSSFRPMPPYAEIAAGGMTARVAPGGEVGIWYRAAPASGADCSS